MMLWLVTPVTISQAMNYNVRRYHKSYKLVLYVHLLSRHIELIFLSNTTVIF